MDDFNKALLYYTDLRPIPGRNFNVYNFIDVATGLKEQLGGSDHQSIRRIEDYDILWLDDGSNVRPVLDSYAKVKAEYDRMVSESGYDVDLATINAVMKETFIVPTLHQ